MKCLLLLAAVVLCAQAEREGIDAEYEDFVDRWFEALNFQTVTGTVLNDFHKSYDNKDSAPPLLNLYEADYKSSANGASSATDQFRIPATYATAFFKLQDLVDFYDENPDTFCRLTPEDSEVAVLIGDDDFDGSLNESEFKAAFKYIFRGASSALLYVNYRPSEGSDRYDDLWSLDDWKALFVTISGGKTLMFPNDFRAFWSPVYGGQTQARDVFDIFDIEQSGYISDLEWELAFSLFDWDGDTMLGVEEFLWIDYLLNEGRGMKLGDSSFVGTKEGHINRMLAAKRT